MISWSIFDKEGRKTQVSEKQFNEEAKNAGTNSGFLSLGQTRGNVLQSPVQKSRDGEKSR